MTGTIAEPTARTPLPRRPNRYRLRRAGIHQVWQYDQVFTFGDGRLLLRGKNGAGKSKALEALLPFLLDGDPRRLDAAGGGKTTLAWLMLDGWTGGTNRLGYLWIEFGRTASDGEEHRLTIGAAVTASTATGEARPVYFATRLAVGEDLPLDDPARRPSVAQLRELIGPDNCYDRAIDYRIRVARELFGLTDPARYRNLVHLLYGLRRPTIGDRIESGELVKVLTEALPPLDDELLDTVARNLDDLDAVRDGLARLEATGRALDDFLSAYRGYLHGVLRGRVAVVRERLDALRAARGAAGTAEYRLSELVREEDAARAAVEEHERALAAADDELRAVRESGNYRGPADLRERAATERAFESAARVAWTAAAGARGAEDDASARLDAAVDRSSADLTDLRARLREARRQARACRLPEGLFGEAVPAEVVVVQPARTETLHDIDGTAHTVRRPRARAIDSDAVPSLDAWRARLADVARVVTDRARAADALHRRLTEVTEAETRLREAEHDVTRAEDTLTGSADRRVLRRRDLESATRAYAESLRTWTARVVTLDPQADVTPLLTLIASLTPCRPAAPARPASRDPHATSASHGAHEHPAHEHPAAGTYAAATDAHTHATLPTAPGAAAEREPGTPAPPDPGHAAGSGHDDRDGARPAVAGDGGGREPGEIPGSERAERGVARAAGDGAHSRGSGEGSGAAPSGPPGADTGERAGRAGAYEYAMPAGRVDGAAVDGGEGLAFTPGAQEGADAGAFELTEVVREAAYDVVEAALVAAGRDRDAVGLRLATVAGELKAAREEQKAWRGQADPEPPRPAGAVAERDAAAGAPLYRLIDFAGRLDDDARAGLEAALEGSGLLAAWVTADGTVIEPHTRDVLLPTPEPSPDAPATPDIAAAASAGAAGGRDALDPAEGRDTAATGADPGGRDAPDSVGGRDAASGSDAVDGVDAPEAGVAPLPAAGRDALGGTDALGGADASGGADAAARAVGGGVHGARVTGAPRHRALRVVAGDEEPDGGAEGDGATGDRDGDAATLAGAFRAVPSDVVSAERIGALLRAIGFGPGTAASWVATDGRWRLGALTGAHVKERAEYVGAGARAATRARKLAELAERIARLDVERDRLTAERDALDERRTALRDALRGLPSAHDMTAAWQAHEEAAADGERLSADAGRARRAAERARAEAVRLRNAVLARASADDLPTDPEALRGVRTSLARLRDAHATLDREIARAVAGVVDVDAARDGWERAHEARIAAERAYADARADLERAGRERRTLEATVGAGERDTAAREQDADRRRAAARAGRGEAAAALADARDRRIRAEEARARAMADLHEHEEAVVGAGGQLRRPLGLPGLAAAAELGDPAVLDERLAAFDAATDGVRQRIGALRTLADEVAAGLGPPEADVTADEIINRGQELRDGLAGGYDAARTEAEGIHRYALHDDTGAHDVAVVGRRIAVAAEQARAQLSAREQDVFERYLLGELGDHLARQVAGAEALVESMNRTLADVRSSHGIGARLVWELAGAADPEVRTAVDLLRGSPALRTRDEAATLRDSLRRRIEAARLADPSAGYAAHLRTALDYRAWYSWRIRVTDAHPGRERALNHRTALSQGEQRVVSYLVLFAAAAAHFSSLADAAPDAPRLILLDDAFAKVDEPTHGRLLGLLVDLDLDFLLTSERMWGAFHTVPNLHIYECLRDPNARGVATVHYTWDGRAKRLVSV